MVFHIDDAYVTTGRLAEVKKMLSHLKLSMEVLEIGCMNEHPSVKYSLEKDSIGWYYECKMDKYVNNTVAEYKQDMKTKLLNHPMPATPVNILMKLSESKHPDQIDQFQNYIGQILYTVLKVLSDCVNAI
jgi:hypothetical protein